MSHLAGSDMIASPAHQARQRRDSNISLATSSGVEDHNNDHQESLHPLLTNEVFESEGEHVFPLLVERTKWWKIYVLHFLFMWNTRTFEYVSIILVASAFPDNLTAASIRGMASTLSTILFASSVGSWIDKSPNPTKPLHTSIVVNHASITSIYLAWMLWPAVIKAESTFAKNSLFGIIILLDVVQVLGTTGNYLSISRDWIPTLVAAGMGSDYTLTHVNAVIARVNLFCKVASPLLLPVIISIFPRGTWIMIVIFITILVWAVEMIHESRPGESIEGLGANTISAASSAFLFDAHLASGDLQGVLVPHCPRVLSSSYHLSTSKRNAPNYCDGGKSVRKFDGLHCDVYDSISERIFEQKIGE
ncbi:hypothetical protein IFR05_005437 [Cadophora sp. M221]|nr:hypothetical protein IFR05_005437 [Cadophora sp. M221]